MRTCLCAPRCCAASAAASAGAPTTTAEDLGRPRTTGMKEESLLPEPLLQAVRASPDDDDVRLVCADWLDDHGESIWAEFIRVQVARARADAAARPALAKREVELSRQHGFCLLELPLAGWMERCPDFPPEVELLRRGGLQ